MFSVLVGIAGLSEALFKYYVIEEGNDDMHKQCHCVHSIHSSVLDYEGKEGVKKFVLVVMYTSFSWVSIGGGYSLTFGTSSGKIPIPIPSASEF